MTSRAVHRIQGKKGRLIAGAIFVAFVHILLACAVFGGTLLDEALELYSQGDYGRAQRVLEEFLQRPAPAQEDAAMFLLVRVHLALRNATKADDLAEKLIKRFPESSYLDDAHYARAEALFLQEELIAAAQELVWVAQNAEDNRLREKALEVLPRLSEKSHTRQERKRLEEIVVQLPAAPQIPEGAVVVLLAFPEEEVPEARALRQSIEFAVAHGSVRFPVMFREARSSLECAQVAGEMLSSEGVRLLLFAGDEGSATTLALLGDKYRVPIILLTGYAKSLTGLSDYIFEFLPSRHTQSSALAEFAVENLKIRSFLELVVSNAEGHAMEEGFRSRAGKAGAVIEAVEWYSPNAPSIRASLRNLFSASQRSGRQRGELSAAVSDSEMTALWGTRDGEVLLLGREDSLKSPPISGDEGLFFAIASGRAADMASQIGSLPQSTVLLGNSAWVDAQSLEEFPEIADNLVASAPMLPDVEAPEGLQALYEDSVGRGAGLWELLGLDAVAFLGGILHGGSDSPRAVYENLLKTSPFAGASVQLDFRGGRENKAVRILRFEDGTFTALK